MKITDKYVFFWDGIFSNWHYIDKMYVEVNGEELYFPTSEHLFMYLKAIYFDDIDVSEQILLAKSPKEAKKLGRMIKNFDESEWTKVREDIMYKTLEMKRRADSDFEKELLKDEYDNKLFVEASPFDKIWGIGLKEDNPDAEDENKWKGLNLLGKTLTRLRDDIKRNKKSI